MQEKELIPHLFRTEYRKITAVLCRIFGLEHIGIAEDIASDTFLQAAVTWGLKGLPENPVAWLYKVSKNKTKDYLKRHNLFSQKIATELSYTGKWTDEIEIDLSNENIFDSQLRMMFAICHPCIPSSAQVGLSLRILCGFGIEEIADAFLSNKETINKRLLRAKEKLRQEKVKIELPDPLEIANRLTNVLTTIYLLFNEGYYSQSQNTPLRKDLCLEAMRLNYLLTENERTDLPQANALLSLMCFHASRFEARFDGNGGLILYGEQNEALWDEELIAKGKYYLNRAATGEQISRYHIEAAIAYWHTNKKDSPGKWENIHQLYNKLLILEYSPIAALNRTYALSKVYGNAAAIQEAEKLNLPANHHYHALLGTLYTNVQNDKAHKHLEKALKLARSATDRRTLAIAISQLKE
jgi:RNA polymerase sigma-70 factor (ECF subfamily)